MTAMKMEQGIKIEEINRASHWKFKQAFTRLDLCCVIFSTAILLGFLLFNFTGERGRIFQCTRNLKRLGDAMQDFAADHNDSLPPAGVQEEQITWDMLITPYLRPDLVISNSAYAKRLLKMAVAPYFICPSDKLVRADPRTYVMSGNDMEPENWPPGVDSATGVGLVWNKQRVENLLGKDALDQAKTNVTALALVKRSSIPDPANTLLLTEIVRSDGQIGNIPTAIVSDARIQVEMFKGDSFRFHHGRFNYLMADGHAELLSPFRAGNAGAFDADRQSGIWTIKKED